MALRILAIIKNGKEDVGYRLYDEISGAVGDFKINEALLQLKHYGCSNVKIEDGKMIGLECSIDRLTVLDTNTNVIQDGGLIVLNKLVNGRETVGYTLVNAKGVKLTLDRDEALLMMTKYGISNASRVTKDGKVYLRGIKKDLNTVDVKGVEKQKESKKKEARLKLYTFVKEDNKTEYVPQAIAVIDNLTKYDIDNLVKLKEKYKRVEIDMLSQSKVRVVSSMDMGSIVECTQQVLNLLTRLDVELVELVWVTGVHFKDDEGFEGILQLKAGEFERAFNDKLCVGGVTPKDNVKVCAEDIKQVLTIIGRWGKSRLDLTKDMSTDMYWIKYK